MKQKTKNALRKIIASPNFRAWPQYCEDSQTDFVLSFDHANCGKGWFGGMPTLRAIAEDLNCELQEGLEVAFLIVDHEVLERGGFCPTLKERETECKT